MKKKYITLEQVLDYRGTDTKIYSDSYDNYDSYWKFTGDVLCRYKQDTNKLLCVGSYLDCDHKELHIREDEDFKVEKVGLYKTRNGKLAFVTFTCLMNKVRGNIEGHLQDLSWCKDGKFIGDNSDNDLVEYIGD